MESPLLSIDLLPRNPTPLKRSKSEGLLPPFSARCIKFVDFVLPPVAAEAPVVEEPVVEEEEGEYFADEEDEEEDVEVYDAAIEYEEAFLARTQERYKGRNNGRRKEDHAAMTEREAGSRSRRSAHTQTRSCMQLAQDDLMLPTEISVLDGYGYDWDGFGSTLVTPEADYSLRREQQMVAWRRREPLQRKRPAEKKATQCGVCYELFGRHMTNMLPLVPGLSYLDAFTCRKRRPGLIAERQNITTRRRHRPCPAIQGRNRAQKPCTVCTDCFSRDMDRQIAKLSTEVLSCPSCYMPLEDYHTALTPTQIEAWDARGILKLIKKMGLVHCPRVGCGQPAIVEPSRTCSLVSCPACHNDWCHLCQVPFHYGMTCRQYQGQDEAMQWRSTNTKPCPNCHVQIEKNRGCNHMHCALCDTHFQWDEAQFGIFVPPTFLDSANTEFEPVEQEEDEEEEEAEAEAEEYRAVLVPKERNSVLGGLPLRRTDSQRRNQRRARSLRAPLLHMLVLAA